jgi:hypothetical protein
MTLTSEQLWGALYRIGFGEGNKTDPKAVAGLVELDIAEMSKHGPQLTDYGQHLFIINDRSGNDVLEMQA